MPSLPGLARQVLGRKIQTRYQLVEQAGFTHTGMAADQTGFPPNKSFQRLQAFRLTGGNRKKSRGGKGIDLLPSFQLFFIPGSEQVHFVEIGRACVGKECRSGWSGERRSRESRE